MHQVFHPIGGVRAARSNAGVKVMDDAGICLCNALKGCYI